LKFSVQMRFRGQAAEIAAILPNEFKFLESALTEAEAADEASVMLAAYSDCRASAIVEREVGEALVTWGRQTRNGATILAGIDIVHVYEPKDLGSSEVVEFCLPHYLDKSRVLNVPAALRVGWACDYCDRVNAEQTADLAVDVAHNYALNLTYNNEWIAPTPFAPFFEHYGLTTRPVANFEDRVQLVIDRTFSLQTAQSPLMSYGTACPGCRRTSLKRQRGIEGHPLDPGYPGIVMYTDSLVTIKPLDAAAITLARSVERLHNPRVGSKPLHKTGEPINYAHISLHYYDAEPIFLAKTELVQQLLDSGANGFAFRPVNIAAA